MNKELALALLEDQRTFARIALFREMADEAARTRDDLFEIAAMSGGMCPGLVDWARAFDQEAGYWRAMAAGLMGPPMDVPEAYRWPTKS